MLWLFVAAGILVYLSYVAVTATWATSDCVYSDWQPCDPVSGKQYRSIVHAAQNGGQACDTTLLMRACTASQTDPCDYSDWSPWSACSAACVPATCDASQLPRQYRTRIPQTNGDCQDLIDFQDCGDLPTCTDPVGARCSYSAWGAWSECTLPCAEVDAKGNLVPGLQYRYRTVAQNAPDCTWDQMVQSQTCNPHACGTCSYGSSWSAWSECSVPCGGGTQFRARALLSGSSPEACVDNIQTAQCNTQSCAVDTASCAPPDWDAVFAVCDRVCSTKESSYSFRLASGYCPITPAVVSAVFGPAGCPCNDAPRDCVYGAWTAWSSCTGECYQGGGTQFRTRTILSPSAFGGAECDANLLLEEQVCNASCSSGSVRDCMLGTWTDATACQRCGPPFFKSQTRTILATASGGGEPCSHFAMMRTVSCGNIPSCSGGSGDTNTCVYGAWPTVSGLDCTQYSSSAKRVWFDSLPRSVQLDWLNVGVGDSLINAGTLSDDLRRLLNAGQSAGQFCVAMADKSAFSLTAAGWTPLSAAPSTGCAAYNASLTTCSSVMQVVDSSGSCTCAGLCPWVGAACSWSSCAGDCGTGIQSMVRVPLQMTAECTLSDMLSQTSCSLSRACPAQCPVACNGQMCGGPAQGSCSSAGSCSCRAGFGGRDCGTTCPTDNFGQVCSGRGSCSDVTGFVCRCNDPFVGVACETRKYSVQLTDPYEGTQSVCWDPTFGSVYEPADGLPLAGTFTANMALNRQQLAHSTTDGKLCQDLGYNPAKRGYIVVNWGGMEPGNVAYYMGYTR
jgi:hypothetical protein